MNTQHNELKRKARFAGFLYLIIVILGFYGIMYVTSQIQVIGDAEATFNNLLENEFLLRTGIFAHLLNTVVFTMMVLVFYRLFGHIDKFTAQLMVALVVLHISFEFGSEALNIAAILVADGQFLESLDALQRQEWGYLLLRTSKFGSVGLASAFWGLWLIPLGTLVYRSGFIPGVFGVALILGGTAYIVESTFFILFPGQGEVLRSLLFYVYAVAEISFMLWLLIKGIKKPPAVNPKQSMQPS